MSKLNFVLRAVSCATMALAGGAVAYRNNTEPIIPEIIPNSVIGETVEAAKELSIKAELKTNTEVANEAGISNSAPATEVTTTTFTSNTTNVAHNQGKPTVSVQSAAPTYKYTSHLEFQKAYVGWCPQDVPADAYHQPLPKYVSLGYTDYNSSTYHTIDEAALYVWKWKVNTEGKGGIMLDVFPSKINDLPGDQNATVVGMKLIANTANGKVTWSQIRGPAQAEENTAKRLDVIASQIEARITEFDNRYYSKCGR